eukprot:m.330998 g.330998  ORF g.330998 m.330998 type:complete len:373 (-) comp16052_c2_seq3:5415-6533(-)
MNPLYCSFPGRIMTSTMAMVVLIAFVASTISASLAHDFDSTELSTVSIAPVQVRGASCRQLLANYTQHKDAQPLVMALNEEQKKEFTLNGLIPTAEYLVDDTNGGEGTHYQFSRKHIDTMIAATTQVLGATSLDELMNKHRLTQTQAWFVQALQVNPIQDSVVCVWGAVSPWYEALALAAGAARTITFEYNKLTFDHPQMITVQPFEVDVKQHRCDVAISTSSFDHDGLGRYGDPIDAFGDIKAMKVARCMLVAGGRMFFTVPVGPDILVFNLHRRYGVIRLGAMLQGFDVLDVSGWNQDKLTAPADYRKSYEPVFVLQRPLPPTKITTSTVTTPATSTSSVQQSTEQGQTEGARRLKSMGWRKFFHRDPRA